MEIEYKRELTKSYMCVKTDQDFLPFEKEILTRSSISGIVPVNTTFADAATVCWYDITGMQAFDHALEMEMMNSQMLTQFLVSLCGTLERLESFLLDPRHLWFSRESIFKNNRDGSFWFCYCPEGKENITEGFQKLMEYLLTKIDHKDQRAVKMAYHIYDQVIKEGYSLIAIRESLTYDRVDIEPVPDRTLENSRVELEQTSDQTEKEKNVHKADKADGKAKVIFQKAIEHFFPDLAKIKEYRQELAKKKEKNSYLYAGLRYAFSSFKYDVSILPANDPIWGDAIGNPSLEDDYWGGSVPFSHLGMKGSVQWLEIVLGVKVRIYKNFNMGWSVRMKYKTKASIGEYGAPWYVPGYGKYKSNNMGITYSLIYKLPL